jgi:hypothetical protein
LGLALVAGLANTGCPFVIDGTSFGLCNEDGGGFTFCTQTADAGSGSTGSGSGSSGSGASGYGLGDAGWTSGSSALSLSVVALPAPVLAPGQKLVLLAQVQGGTPNQQAQFNTITWSATLHAGETFTGDCAPDEGSSPCVGSLNGGGAATTSPNVSTSGATFIIQYLAYASTTTGVCSAQPAVGYDIDIAAFSEGADAGAISAETTVHIGCSTLIVTSPTANLGSTSNPVTFTANEPSETDGGSGTPVTPTWAVYPLGNSLDNPGQFDANVSGLYTSPSPIPTDVPAALVIATSLSDESVMGGALIWFTTTPAVLNISPTTSSLFNGQTQSFSATHAGGPEGAAVTWSLSKPGTDTTSTLTVTDTSTAVLTIGSAIAPEELVVSASLVASDSLYAQASAAVTSTGPVGLQVSPSTASVISGYSAAFQAVYNNAAVDAGVSWSLSPTPPAGSDTTIDGGVLYIDPRESDAGYTVIATSELDSTQTGSAAVTVPGDPVGYSGTVSYSGAQSGRTYVVCVTRNTSSGIPWVGATALARSPTAGDPVPYRLHGVACPSSSLNPGEIVAWMDVKGVGHYVVGQDPFVAQTVPGSGNVVDLTMTDPTGTPLADGGLPDEGDAGVSFPTIPDGGILPQISGAAISYQTYGDQNGEWAQQYRISYVTTANLDVDGGPPDGSIGGLTVNAGTGGLAFVEGLTGDTDYSFAIQALFTPFDGGATIHIPSNMQWSPSVAIPGAVDSVFDSNAASIVDSVNVTSLGLDASTPELQVLVRDQIGLAGAASEAIAAPLDAVPYDVRDLTPSDTVGVYFFVDSNANGELDPTDTYGITIDNLIVAETFLGIFGGNGPPFFAPDISNISIGAGVNAPNPNTWSFPPPTTLAKIFSATIWVEDPPQLVLTDLVYMVTSPHGLLSATRAPLPWWDNRPAVDLFSPYGYPNAGFAISPLPMPGPFLSIPAPRTDNVLASGIGDPVTFFVHYPDGSQGVLTTELEDAPSSNMEVSISGELPDGGGVGVTPSLNWSSPVLAPGNFIDHYDVFISDSSHNSVYSTSLSSPGVTIPSGSLMAGDSYMYTVVAVDSYGNIDVAEGTFTTST